VQLSVVMRVGRHIRGQHGCGFGDAVRMVRGDQTLDTGRMESPILGVTDREHDVLRLVAGHLTNAEIAEQLFLSVRTVESHVSSLIRKLGVTDRRGLVRRADELGLLRRGRAGRWPVVAGDFLGRVQETATLADWMARHRMVTVAGPGGIGKTRLTIQTAQQVAEERPDGGWFVDLSQVVDPHEVVQAVAMAVGVVEHPGLSTEDALCAVLGRADGLLVLDNCEHLLDDVERCVTRVVRDCPGITVVATSRARLGTAYERVYELPALTTDDGVLLFRARAEAAGGGVPEEAGVAELCARLEGMALAIELAATRYPSLGMDGLTAALENPLQLLGSDERARQRSLRATIAWSVDLIDDEARALLAACSVFVAGFTVRAAREVASPDRTDAGVAQVLAALADQHLLLAEIGTPTTYRFQEVVRQYSAELLGGRAAQVALRHARWAATELDSLSSHERDDAWCEAFDLLAVELRSALARVPDQRELAERFAEETLLRGRLEEAQRLFEAQAAADDNDRIRLLRLAAGAAAARLVGDETMRLLDEASVAAGVLGNQEAEADALGWSVLFASLYPGIMAHPPAVEVTASRLNEARRRAPAGSSAVATVAAAAAAFLADDDPEAEPAGRAAAAQAVAAGLPVVASAALDRVCASRLLRWQYADGLAAVAARGEVMDPLPLDATTAFAFNDYLLMGCEASLAAGDLPGATMYAGRLVALPCYRDYVHPAMARQLQVDVLAGDLAGATRHGELFRTSWERAGRHQASTLAVGPYALALAHGLLGQDREREEWRSIALELDAGRLASPDGVETGWAPTLDAWLLLDRSQPEAALAILTVDVDHPVWASWATSLWRPWYAAAWAEASAFCGVADLDVRLSRAATATQDNPVAGALVRRAEALAIGDLVTVCGLATTFDALGAAYQRDRSRELAA
jgi:predicted ATPase/DNA-binding CsgD family transcriptional regulator